MSARLFPRNLLHLVMFAAVCLLVLRPGVCAWSSESADVQGADKDAAAEPPPKPPDKVPVIVSVNVPLNANARDEFILSPLPVEPPKVTDNDFELPTGSDELKLLLKNTVLYKRGEAGQHPPDWRVDRALK